METESSAVFLILSKVEFTTKSSKQDKDIL